MRRQLRRVSVLNRTGPALPSEVPGLDDAAAAWYDLEALTLLERRVRPHREASTEQQGNLPFGFRIIKRLRFATSVRHWKFRCEDSI